MAYFLNNYPVSEESANLELTEEQEKYCRVVYKLDEKGDAYFYELWNPDKEYSDEYAVLPLRSTGGTVVTLTPGGGVNQVQTFANVIGSSSDPCPDPSNVWLKYWLNMTGTQGGIWSCCTDGNFYYLNNHQQERTVREIFVRDDLVNAACSSRDMRGGHVILNVTKAATVLEDGPVYILPICNNHNIGRTSYYGSYGEGFYMKLGAATQAIQLQGYKPRLISYIRQNQIGGQL